jgi:hypothetical protein
VTEITYWIDRKFWKQGIVTQALKIFLTIETVRPLFGRVAFDNFGRHKVLEKSFTDTNFQLEYFKSVPDKIDGCGKFFT